MKITKSQLPLTTAVLLSAILVVPSRTADAGVAAISDCAAVGRKTKAMVADDPAKVLVILEDSLVAHPDCACEIVKGAILGVEADHDLVEQIVVTAVTTVEEKAAEIAECAIHAAPDAAKYVKSGLETALGTFGSSSAPHVAGSSLDVNGVYLIPPVPAPSVSPANMVP